MDVILRGEPKEIAALALAVQGRQLPELIEKVAEHLVEELNRSASFVRIPE